MDEVWLGPDSQGIEGKMQVNEVMNLNKPG